MALFFNSGFLAPVSTIPVAVPSEDPLQEIRKEAFPQSQTERIKFTALREVLLDIDYLERVFPEAFIKQESYFSRLRSKESWDEWTEWRTTLGKFVYDPSQGKKIARKANEEAKRLLAKREVTVDPNDFPQIDELSLPKVTPEIPYEALIPKNAFHHSKKITVHVSNLPGGLHYNDWNISGSISYNDVPTNPVFVHLFAKEAGSAPYITTQLLQLPIKGPAWPLERVPIALEEGKERYDFHFNPQDFGLRTIDKLWIESFSEEWAKTHNNTLTLFPPKGVSDGVKKFSFQVAAKSGTEEKRVGIELQVYSKEAAQPKLLRKPYNDKHPQKGNCCFQKPLHFADWSAVPGRDVRVQASLEYFNVEPEKWVDVKYDDKTCSLTGSVPLESTGKFNVTYAAYDEKSSASIPGSFTVRPVNTEDDKFLSVFFIWIIVCVSCIIYEKSSLCIKGRVKRLNRPQRISQQPQRRNNEEEMQALISNENNNDD